MERTDDEQTDFEILFRGQGLPIGQCAFQSLPVAEEKPLAPLTLPPEMLPREMDDETAEDEPTGRMAMLLKKNKERHGAAHLQV
jgi:hypothetical protein